MVKTLFWSMIVGFIVMLALATTYAYFAGQRSVKQIDRICPEQKAKLITSSHSNAGTICVYQASWKNKGKIKRVEL